MLNLFQRGVAISLLLVILIPAFALASPSDPQSDPSCWKKEDCAKARTQLLDKQWLELTDEEKKYAEGGFVKDSATCGDGDTWGKCLPGTLTETMIAFGGQRRFASVGEFLTKNYTYALSIAGILAAVMIIVAGFQWVTSGGNSEAITSAKKRIGGSVIGLFIAYMSYFILTTINPALVNLRLPQAWLIRNNNLAVETSDWCDPTGGSQTRTNCEKEGKICVPINWVDPELSTPCTTVYKGLTFAMVGAAGVVSGAVAIIGGGLNATVGQLVRSGGAQMVKYTLPVKNATGAVNTTVQVLKLGGGAKLLIPAAFLLGDLSYFGGAGTAAVAGGVGGAVVDAAKATGGLTLDALKTAWYGSPNGMCVGKAADLGNGDICGEGSECSSGKCIPGPFSSSAKCFAGTEFGFCTDGLNNSPCDPDSYLCKEGISCVKNAQWGIYTCSDGTAGSTCESDSDCTDLKCSRGRCAPAIFHRVAEGGPCRTSNNCAVGKCYAVKRCGIYYDLIPEGGDTMRDAHILFTDMYNSGPLSASGDWSNGTNALGFCHTLGKFTIDTLRTEYAEKGMWYCQVWDPGWKREGDFSPDKCTVCTDVDEQERLDFAPYANEP